MSGMAIECSERRMFGLLTRTYEVSPGTEEVLEAVPGISKLSPIGRTLFVEDQDTIIVRHTVGLLTVREIKREGEEINLYDAQPKGEVGLKTIPTSIWDKLTRHTRQYSWKKTGTSISG